MHAEFNVTQQPATSLAPREPDRAAQRRRDAGMDADDERALHVADAIWAPHAVDLQRLWRQSL